MLRRTLPLAFAAFVIVPALAQTPIISPTTPQRGVIAPATGTYFPERLDWQHKKPE
jgi:hypothetical protein